MSTALFLIGVTIFIYAPLGQRGNIFTFVILVLSLLTAKFPKIRLRWVLGIGILVFFGMETLVVWRTAIRYNTNFYDVISTAYALEGIDRGDFDAFAGVVAYNVRIGYDSWWNFTEQLIPRSLYPSKSDYIAVSYLMDQEIIGRGTAGLTATIIGTLLAQGGSITVAIGGLCVGVLVRVLQNICIHKVQTPDRALLGGISTAFMLLLTRNGDLTNVIIMLVSNLAGVFLLVGVVAVLPIWRRYWHYGSCHTVPP